MVDLESLVIYCILLYTISKLVALINTVPQIIQSISHCDLLMFHNSLRSYIEETEDIYHANRICVRIVQSTISSSVKISLQTPRLVETLAYLNKAELT